MLWWDQELEAAWDERWPPKKKRAPSEWLQVKNGHSQRVHIYLHRDPEGAV